MFINFDTPTMWNENNSLQLSHIINAFCSVNVVNYKYFKCMSSKNKLESCDILNNLSIIFMINQRFNLTNYKVRNLYYRNDQHWLVATL